jgi:PKD repeat protein
MVSNYKFLYDGTINDEQLLNLQYYYDLFSDVLLAYEELRKTGSELISICCPDSNLFPRHLFLDLAIPDASKATSEYRHYFIPSPILQGNAALVKSLRSLFKKIVLLLQKFYMPPVELGGGSAAKRLGIDENIRITPSKYGDIALSEKSIPFYYKVTDGPDKLLEEWSFRRSVIGQANKNLSYHAATYNAADEDVYAPLLYDIEPYNFLRIEGHLGKSYTSVLRNILQQKRKYRLPFEVIALSADVAALRDEIRGLSGRTSASGLSDTIRGQEYPQCQFQDLESLYDTLAAELTCSLCKEMKYFYGMPGNDNLPPPASTVPQATLLRKCDPNFRYTAGTFGHQFELFFASVKDQPYVTAGVFVGTLLGNFSVAGAVANNNDTLGLALLYYIEKLSETVSADLSDFDIAQFTLRYNDMVKVATLIRANMRQGNETGTMSEDVLDHLDALIFACKQAQFTALYKEYLSRWLYVMMLQKFGYFLQMHPGIQHKAGVTVGGTFILVYHQATEDTDTTRPVNPATGAVLVDAVANPVFTGSGFIMGSNVADIQADAVRTVRAAKEKVKTETKKVEAPAAAAPTAPAEDAATAVQERAARSEELLRKSLAGSKINGSRHLQYLQSVLAEGDDTSELDPLIDELEDGIVIADFFLPYLCYSDCPPVNFILGDEKEPEEKVTIGVKQTDYCSIDKTNYPIEVSPAGGTVTGEGVKATNSKFTFSPSNVDLQGNKQKSITLTYTKNSRSASTQVVVFQTPTASFTFGSGRVARIVRFTNTSNFADTFAWDFGDGEKSTEENPQHTYKDEGTYTVTLTVTNGQCTSNPQTQTVEVKPQQQERSCFPLADIVKEFEDLGQNQILDAFIKSFPTYNDIAAVFKDLQDVATKPVADQLKYFAENKIPDRLIEWLNELFRIIQGNNDFTTIALALYRVLAKLAMYIQCIQDGDLGKTEVNMRDVFRLIQSHMKILAELAKQSPTRYQIGVNALVAAFKEEIERVDEVTRPLYFNIIMSYLQMLS